MIHHPLTFPRPSKFSRSRKAPVELFPGVDSCGKLYSFLLSVQLTNWTWNRRGIHCCCADKRQHPNVFQQDYRGHPTELRWPPVNSPSACLFDRDEQKEKRKTCPVKITLWVKWRGDGIYLFSLIRKGSFYLLPFVCLIHLSLNNLPPEMSRQRGS